MVFWQNHLLVLIVALALHVVQMVVIVVLACWVRHRLVFVLLLMICIS